MRFAKKRIFLYSSILLLILVGVYFTDAFGIINRNPSVSRVTTSTNAVTTVGSQNPSYSGVNFTFTELSNWTRGGSAEVFNFTLNFSTNVALNGTYQINITLPSGFSVNTTDKANSSLSGPDLGYGSIAVNWTLNITSSTVSITQGQNNISEGDAVSIWFSVYANNGTEAVRNWTITTSDNTTSHTTDSGFGILTGIDGLAPTASSHNATDGPNTVTPSNGITYLKYDTANTQQGINISVTITDYNADRVLLVYNNTGGSLNLAGIRNLLYDVNFLTGNNSALNNASRMNNFTVLINNGSNLAGTGGDAGFVPALGSRSTLVSTAPSYVFTFNISNSTWGTGASDTTAFNYVFVVYDLYNQSEIINSSNAAFSIGRDINNPTASITAPTTTSIETSNPIKYTCDCADTGSLSTCSTKITKPNGDTVTKTGDATEHTFTGTDTNGAGTYSVDCTATDSVGRTGTASQKTFTVSYASGGSSGAGGGGGSGGSGSPGTTIENPVSIEAGITSDLGSLSSSGAYTSISQSGAINFAVAGGQHSVKVLTVTQNSATIEVASTPQQVTLNIGDTREFDLNDDTKNDMSITLNSITNGKADLLFKAIIQEVLQPETGGEVTGEPAKANLTWLWILIAVVVIALIWYFTKKKQ